MGFVILEPARSSSRDEQSKMFDHKGLYQLQSVCKRQTPSQSNYLTLSNYRLIAVTQESLFPDMVYSVQFMTRAWF